MLKKPTINLRLLGYYLLCCTSAQVKLGHSLADVCTDAHGQPVTLKDIWPTDAEIDAVVAQSVKPEHFRQVYDPMFKIGVVTATTP